MEVNFDGVMVPLDNAKVMVNSNCVSLQVTLEIHGIEFKGGTFDPAIKAKWLEILEDTHGTNVCVACGNPDHNEQL